MNCTLWLVLGATLSMPSSPALPQSTPDEANSEEVRGAVQGDDGGSSEKPAPQTPLADPSGFDEEVREAIQALFPGAEVKFPGERVVELDYKFTRSGDDSKGDDFVPAVSRDPKHMRWSRGWEGNTHSWSYGLVVNKFGRWTHKGVWSEVEAEIEWGQLSEYMKPKDVVAVVYTWDRGKKMIGSNWGHACVKLSRSLKLAAKPIPATRPTPLVGDSEKTFGMRYKNGILYSLTKGNVKSKTSKKKYVKDVEPGRVGLVWNGQWVKGVVQRFKIKGVLDPKWLAKETGAELEK